MTYDKEHIRHCMRFAYNLNKNTSEAAKIICSAYGEDAVSKRTCRKWFSRFRDGDFS